MPKKKKPALKEYILDTGGDISTRVRARSISEARVKMIMKSDYVLDWFMSDYDKINRTNADEFFEDSGIFKVRRLMPANMPGKNWRKVYRDWKESYK